MKTTNKRYALMLNKLRNVTLAKPVPMLSAPLHIIGVGTSGSDIMLQMFNEAKRQFGQKPANVTFTSIEADKDPRPNTAVHRREIEFIPIGKAGSGSNTFRGRQLAAERYSAIQSTSQQLIIELMETSDARFPTNLPGSQLQAALLLGGAGGTSGGGIDLLITAIRESTKKSSLETMEINLATIGPKIPVTDIDRSSDSPTAMRLSANSADNNQHWYSQMNTRRKIEEHPPADEPFTVNASERIHTKIEFDHKNPTTTIHRNSDMHSMIASSLFSRFFTAVGKEREARVCDLIVNGITGQMSPAEGSIAK